MHFRFTQEHVQLRQSVGALLRDRYSFETRQQASRAFPAWSPAMWQTLANELGVLGLPLPEAEGGLSGDPIATMILMEQFGESLLLEPFLETAVLCGALLRLTGGATADRVLASIAAGSAVLCFAHGEHSADFNAMPSAVTAMRDGDGWSLCGRKSVVVAAPVATDLIVSAMTENGPSLFLVDAAAQNLTLAGYPLLDARPAADLHLDGVRVQGDALLGREGGAGPVIAEALDRTIAALAAEALGVMRRLLSDTIAFTKQRRQFGRPIADNQALQHRMADMFMQLEMATSAVYLATLKLDRPAKERALAVACAKVTVGRAGRFIGQNAVQLHGGMGMTDELAISHYFKRMTVIEAEFGSADQHLQRFVELSRAA